MIAARKGNYEITKILVGAGADVNIGLEGDTALSLAAWNGYKSIVETLVKNGAEVNHMALDRARQNNHHEIVKLLQNSVKDKN